jgi:hypothetical protein
MKPWNKAIYAVVSLIAIIYCSISVTAAPTIPGPQHLLKGKASANEEIDRLESVGIKCFVRQGAHNELVIDKVRPGSAASYKGVTEHDIVTAVTPNGDGFDLDFARDGKNYRVYLKSQLLKPTRFKNEKEADNFLSSLEKQIADSQQKRLTTIQEERDAPKKAEEAEKLAMKNESSVKIGEHIVTQEEILSTKNKAIKQGAVPNCWFEASLAAVVESPGGRLQIANMIEKSGDRTYRVTFPEQAFPGDSKYVDISIDEIALKYDVHDKTLWARVLDAACQKKYPDNDGINKLTGLKILTGMPVQGISPMTCSQRQVSDLLEQVVTKGEPTIMGTSTRSTLTSLPPWHAFTVVGFDKKCGVATLKNPWSGDPLYFGKEDFANAKPITDNEGVRLLGDGLVQVNLDAIVGNFNGIVWAEKQ